MNNPNWLSWLLQLKYLPKSWFLYGILARVQFALRPQKLSTAGPWLSDKCVLQSIFLGWQHQVMISVCLPFWFRQFKICFKVSKYWLSRDKVLIFYEHVHMPHAFKTRLATEKLSQASSHVYQSLQAVYKWTEATFSHINIQAFLLLHFIYFFTCCFLHCAPNQLNARKRLIKLNPPTKNFKITKQCTNYVNLGKSKILLLKLNHILNKTFANQRDDANLPGK